LRPLGQLRLYRRRELEGWVDRETDRKGVRRQLSGIRFEEAHEQFIAECRAGIALNRHGRKYTKKAIKDLDSSLNRLPARIKDKYLDEITDPNFQRVIDDFKAEAAAVELENQLGNRRRPVPAQAGKETREGDDEACWRRPASGGRFDPPGTDRDAR